jgi:hypothetical protein
METSTDEIRRELDQKRDALTRDVERLEAKVKNTFDLGNQISERPLLSVGLAVVGGVILGRMGSPGPSRAMTTSSYAHGHRTGGGAITPYGSAWSNGNSAEQPGAAPGIVEQVRAGFQGSVKQGVHSGGVDLVLANVTAALTALLVDKAKELLDQNLPGFAAQFDQLAESDRSSIGGARSSSYVASAMGPSPYPDPLASAASTTAASMPVSGNRPSAS